MKHSRFGLVFLLSCGGLLACNGDPTASIRDDNPPEIVADPSVLFLNQGESKTVTVQLVDAQGNQLPADFEATGGSQVTVTQDTTFLQTTNGTNLNTKERFVVTSVDAGQTTITVTGGGATLDIPVSVVPSAFAGTFSNAAPAVNEAVTLTAPSGYTFDPAATVLIGADSAIVSARAEDGSSITFIPAPGATGTATVNGVLVSFVPGASLELATVDAITVSSTVPSAAGTGATGTAPTVFAVGAAGTSGIAYDAADFTGGVTDRFYNFTVAEDGDYVITVDWSVGSDVDVAVDGDFAGGTATGNKPETATFTLTAGTHQLDLNDFGADAANSVVTIRVDH